MSESWRVRPLKDKARGICGHLAPPSDKSISHRALLFGSLAEGESRIEHLLDAEDVGRTRDVLRACGVSILTTGRETTVLGKGLLGLRAPTSRFLYCGNSGTTLRLLMGLFAPQAFSVHLTGDPSLGRRPMGRVMEPLRAMGAVFRETRDPREGRVVEVEGRPLKGICYQSPVASAQVKSALLIAGLYADGATEIREPLLSRDHTERLLQGMGARLSVCDRTVRLNPGQPLSPLALRVPGDPSSAAFFIVAALLLPHSELRIEHISLNPTRIAFLDVLKRMGGDFTIVPGGTLAGEPVGDVVVRSSELVAADIAPEAVPGLIDEIPILAIAFARAVGTSTVRGAQELRVKESDRIRSTVALLRALGVSAEESEDGFAVEGRKDWTSEPFAFASDGDHRIAMSAAVAALAGRAEIRIDDAECVRTSFPNFLTEWARLGADAEVGA